MGLCPSSQRTGGKKVEDRTGFSNFCSSSFKRRGLQANCTPVPADQAFSILMLLLQHHGLYMFLSLMFPWLETSMTHSSWIIQTRPDRPRQRLSSLRSLILLQRGGATWNQLLFPTPPQATGVLSPFFFTPRSCWPTVSGTLQPSLLVCFLRLPIFYLSLLLSRFSISRHSPRCNILSFPCCSRLVPGLSPLSQPCSQIQP